ncbi:MAG: aldehyde dehydrogenase family protein [Phycisphaerales bacterium]|nr:aldehyde dehydrogenase family protein [Phycisphaerales bacterium]
MALNKKCNLVDGDWVSGDGSYENSNPSDLSDPVGTYTHATPAQAEEAMSAAVRSLPSWSMVSPQLRCDILDRIGTLILQRTEELGRTLAREEGKTLPEAIGEAVRAGQIFKYFAGEALRNAGDYISSTRPGVDVEVTREPVGVCVLITPWNFPIAIPAWKMAPALAYGNTVILKPAELVPATAAALCEIAVEAGIPQGVVNMLVGKGKTVGSTLVGDERTNAVSFTGSTETGRWIAKRCGELGKKVQCEMGGKNPMVILEDADLGVAVDVSINGAFHSTGQRCTASSRLIVVDRLFDAFFSKFKERTESLVVGHALDPSTQIGPVVDQSQLEKDIGYLEIARGDGADVIGGQQLSLDTDGYYLRPAALVGTSPDARVNREEIFGPVASIIRVKDEDEALEVANATPFGLSAGVCTTSLARSRRFKRELQAGMVMVNLPTAGVDHHVPFGGTKASSIGPREQGSHARDFYTVVKTTYVA